MLYFYYCYPKLHHYTCLNKVIIVVLARHDLLAPFYLHIQVSNMLKQKINWSTLEHTITLE